MGEVNLKSFVAKRTISAIPTVFLVLLIGFVAPRLAPGDPISVIAGDLAPPEVIESIRVKDGLTEPIYTQFFLYLGRVIRGDFGFSFAYRQSVLEVIFERVPATALLVSSSILFSLIVGIALASLSSRHLNSTLDKVLTSASMIGYSLPVFWLGQLLIYFFALELDLFPAGGMVDFRASNTGLSHLLDVLYHLTLPALNLGLIYTGLIARLTRAEMSEVLTYDFILTARAKGVPENKIISKHVLRNSLSPVATMTGVLFGLMFAGAIFTETIFSWPGLGRLLYDALFKRDYPVITAMFVLTSLTLIVANSVIDIIYSVIDPRIRVE